MQSVHWIFSNQEFIFDFPADALRGLGLFVIIYHGVFHKNQKMWIILLKIFSVSADKKY